MVQWSSPLNLRSARVSIQDMGSSTQRLALLVGINRYRHLAPAEHLRGAVRDAEEMADILAGRFAFPAGGIRLLRDDEATRDTVLGALRDLAEQAMHGTVIVIHWSGHGSQTLSWPEPPGDMPSSPLQDETLVPFDARGDGADDGVGDITDKELQVELSRLKAQGAWVTWITDACHSGHIYRDRRFGRARRIVPALRSARSPPAPAVRGIDQQPNLRGWLCQQDRQVLLAACRADQEAYEQPVTKHNTNGEWTFALLAALGAAPKDATARQVFNRATTYLLANDVPQSPQLVGARDRLIFGVEARPPVPFVEIRSRMGARVELVAGRAQGIMEASLWDVYPPDAEKPHPDASAVRVRIVEVGALASGAEIEAVPSLDTPVREIAIGDRAFEAVPAYGELRLGVRVLGTAAPSLRQELERQILNSPLLRTVEPSEENSVVVEPCEESCSVVDARGFSLLELAREPDLRAARKIIDRLEKRARWRHGLHLGNRDPASQVVSNLRVELLRQDTAGSWRPATSAADPPTGTAEDQPAPDFISGDLVAFEISHTFPDDLYIYILDFGLTDCVTQIFPPPGGEELLASRGTLRPGTRAGDELELWLPDEAAAKGGGMCFYKVFATTQATSFDWLQTDARWPSVHRGQGPASLARLLAMGAAGPVFRGRGDDWGALLLPIRLRSR